jgi:aspartate beta-hydroxylase
MQRPRWFFPGLTARPWHDPRAFDWTASLEGAAHEIREEVVSLCGHVPPDAHPAQDQLVSRGSWRAHPLQSASGRVEASLARCPRTSQLLDSIPDRTPAGKTYVSVLEPGTRVRAHSGPTNLRLRCHLALVAPAGCKLRVAGFWRRWSAGKCLMFDDSFEHEAHNASRERRVVLIVDVWHPELTQAERDAITHAWHQLDVDRALRVGALAAFAPGPPVNGTTVRR